VANEISLVVAQQLPVGGKFTIPDLDAEGLPIEVLMEVVDAYQIGHMRVVVAVGSEKGA